MGCLLAHRRGSEGDEGTEQRGLSVNSGGLEMNGMIQQIIQNAQ